MATAPKPGILTRLRVKRVALVDVGANLDQHTGDGAHIMLYKRHVEHVEHVESEKEGGPSLGSVHCDSPEWDVHDADEYEKATLVGDARRELPDSAFAAVWTDAEGKKHRKLPIHDAGHLAAARGRIDQAQIPDDVKAEAHRKIEAATNKEKPVAKGKFAKLMAAIMEAVTESDVTKRAAAVAAVLKDAEGMEMAAPDAAMTAAHCDEMQKMIDAHGPGPHAPEHPVHAMKAALDAMKRAGGAVAPAAPAVSPEVAKRFEDIEKANISLQKRLDAEIDKGARVEVHTLLKSFQAVPFVLEGDAAVNDVDKYMAIKKADPVAFDAIIAKFKAVDAQMAQSAAFTNFGKGGSGGKGDAWGRIEAEAAKLISKDGKLTKEQAIDQVLVDPEHAQLIKQYREQQQ